MPALPADKKKHSRAPYQRLLPVWELGSVTNVAITRYFLFRGVCCMLYVDYKSCVIVMSAARCLLSDIPSVCVGTGPKTHSSIIYKSITLPPSLRLFGLPRICADKCFFSVQSKSGAGCRCVAKRLPHSVANSGSQSSHVSSQKAMQRRSSYPTGRHYGGINISTKLSFSRVGPRRW